MMRNAALLALFIGAGTLAGCSNGGGVSAGSTRPGFSPVVGTWTGKSEVKGGDLAKFANSVAGGPLTGPCSMTLYTGGTGFLKIADKPERPISWKQEGDHLILEPRSIQGTTTTQADGAEAGGPWVARWSNDSRTWTIDMENSKVTFDKHTAP